MRFNISNTFTITIAPHVKTPYADNMLNAFREKDINYNYIQNTMYRISGEEYVTYFYTKNNLISYYRQFKKQEGTFVPDTTRNTYKFIEFRKDDSHSKRPKTLLTKSIKNNKWHVISINTENNDKNYAIIITNDEVTGNMHVKHIKLYADMLIYPRDYDVISDYPLHNDIFVIFSYTSQQIILTFINVSEDKSDIISWHLNEIGKILLDMISNINEEEKLKYEISDDSILQMDDILIYRKEYLYKTRSDNTLCVHSIRAECKIQLKGNKHNYELGQVLIYITAEEDSLLCFWDFNYAYIHIFNPQSPKKPIHTILCKQYLKNTVLFMQKHTINARKSCNDKLRNNDCYYIRHNKHRLEVVKMDNWLRHCEIDCTEDYSLYDYKNYHIIICKSHVFKLAIVDKKSNFIGIMISRDFFPTPIEITNDFEYYHSSLNNKLVFLSNDLVYLFFVNAQKIDEIFDVKYKEGCRYSYDEKLDLVRYFSIPEKLTLAINNRMTEDYDNTITQLVGAYIDKKSDKLYIAAEYRIEDTEYYGLFMWDMADNDANFKLLYTTLANKVYNMTHNKNKECTFNISKLTLLKSDLYGYRFIKTKMMHLGVIYSGDHRFINMKHNRISHYIPVPNGFLFEDSSCHAKSVKNVGDNLVVAYYNCSYYHQKSITDPYYYFVLSSTSLVKNTAATHIISVNAEK
jgi:hypothetical protein